MLPSFEGDRQQWSLAAHLFEIGANLQRNILPQQPAMAGAFACPRN
jgi:hypothetical protein